MDLRVQPWLLSLLPMAAAPHSLNMHPKVAKSSLNFVNIEENT